MSRFLGGRREYRSIRALSRRGDLHLCCLWERRGASLTRTPYQVLRPTDKLGKEPRTGEQAWLPEGRGGAPYWGTRKAHPDGQAFSLFIPRRGGGRHCPGTGSSGRRVPGPLVGLHQSVSGGLHRPCRRLLRRPPVGGRRGCSLFFPYPQPTRAYGRPTMFHVKHLGSPVRMFAQFHYKTWGKEKEPPSRVAPSRLDGNGCRGSVTPLRHLVTRNLGTTRVLGCHVPRLAVAVHARRTTLKSPKVVALEVGFKFLGSSLKRNWAGHASDCCFHGFPLNCDPP